MYHNELAKDPSKLLDQLLQLREEVFQEGTETYQRWEPKIKSTYFLNSAQNLAFYLSLRRRDIREIQEALTPWGLSSLGRLESFTIHNMDAVIASLSKIIGQNDNFITHPSYNAFSMGKWQLEENTKRVFGESAENRYSRIMVTLPTEAADDYTFVYELMFRGMNVARINCAHDNPDVWSNMIEQIRRAEKELERSCKILMDIAGPKIRIERLSTSIMNPKVNVGDVFFLTANKVLQKDYGMDIIAECHVPEIISALKVGDPILMDDGKIEVEVETVTDEGVIVRVKKVKVPKGVKIKAEKGISFPNLQAKIDIITEKDKQDLDFICGHADIIGCSFVKDPEDIRLFQSEIRKRLDDESARKITLMAKIETVQAVQNLPGIIVTGASQNPFCVMIARGDLAVEVGYLRLAELQEEILWICEAAHIPVVWATQVLESMVKTGIPTRAEITDAVEGARAECVMLNKGEFVRDGVSILDNILGKMQAHQYKKTSKLRALSIAKENVL